MKKTTITISIASALVGAGLLGVYLTSEQIEEVIITETEMEMSEENYKILTIGIADKYDLPQIDGDRKITFHESYILIDAWDKKLKELNGLKFTYIDTSKYQKSIIYKMNNYIRYDSEKVK